MCILNITLKKLINLEKTECLEYLAKKLDKLVLPENRTTPHPQILMPVLETIFLTDGLLQKMFLGLLASASDKTKKDYVQY